MTDTSADKKGKYYERFDAYSRFLHVLVITSFISLAITGMIIKFSGIGVFQSISNFLGGYAVTGFIHRVAAVVTFVYFGLHIGYLIRKVKKKQSKFTSLLHGENSLVPNKNDLTELIATMKWFIGKGPRPEYGRWTYWEKFDYWAVFWGVAVIGLSGLILWFPEFFTSIGLPGWFINIATIVHSDEALLAVGFIFTYHFFNTHFRPDKFPMDTVIFTGHVPLEEYKKDRPREYQELVESGNLDKVVVEKEISYTRLKTIKFFGYLFLATGIAIVILIVYSMIAGVY